MTKKQKAAFIRIIITALIFFPLLILEHTGGLDKLPLAARIIVFLIPYGIIGYDVVKKACRNILKGKVFDENFLMMIATFGALAVQEFPEAVAVMLFYQVGELFQSYAVGKSRKSISDMMDMAPEYANLETEGGISSVDPDDVPVGSIIVIKPGEKIPLDGVVIEGDSMLDTSALTGESVPRRIHENDDIISGCINGNGTLRVRTTKEYDDSTVAKILELVENASDKKAKVENFITRFAKYYTPVVTLSAVALAVLGPVISGGGVASVSKWLLRACTFLVVSCPCALVISVPLGFFGGIGAASKKGILIKGSNYLEMASKVDTVVFDKTGTLTKGEFKVSKVIARNMTADELLEIAAHAESYSTHPIAVSILEAYERVSAETSATGGTKDREEGSEKSTSGRIDPSRIENAHEDAGHGVDALIDGKHVVIGNGKHMDKHGIKYDPCDENGTIVYVAEDGRYAGAIVISDTVKDGASEAIDTMKRAGVNKCVMLTGDREAAAKSAAKELKVDKYYAELLPGDKVSKVEELLKSENEGSYLAFVGDGINDAPVLARADIGIAMGSMGSDAAIEAADIVLMDDDVRKISTVIKISRRTMKIVRQNIVFAIGVKLAVLVLSAFGITNMWAAVFADVGVAVLAILNSMRTLKST
ncbi:MAG: heavy metal translocating P-type ATPase [Lachnospiraceae bacterium]|nr:heavy metal translocating P-type ATPase [Lachnospiraceae bacterium]